LCEKEVAAETQPASKKAKFEPPKKETKQDTSTEKGHSIFSDPVIKKVFESLEKIQDEIDKINDKESQEVMQIASKYNQLRKPHYQARSKELEKIPDFWPQVFLRHPLISQLLDNADDADAISYLINVTVDELERPGFKITLTFKENPYFTNKELVKEIVFGTENTPPKFTSTKINWKPGKNIVQKLRQMSGDGDEGENESVRSFFEWFNPDEDDEDLAQVIRDEIWPDPLKIFLGQDDDEGEEEGAEGEGDGDEGEGEVEGDVEEDEGEGEGADDDDDDDA